MDVTEGFEDREAKNGNKQERQEVENEGGISTWKGWKKHSKNDFYNAMILIGIRFKYILPEDSNKAGSSCDSGVVFRHGTE